MIKKIKDILGIEGVKIELILEEQYELREGKVDGQLRFTSQNDKEIESVHISLIEKYRRGRGESELINVYTLGAIDLELNMAIAKNEERIIDFELPYVLMKSDMDKLEDSTPLSRPLIWLAKKLKKVKSEYHIEAEAIIKGTRLHPIDKKSIELK